MARRHSSVSGASTGLNMYPYSPRAARVLARRRRVADGEAAHAHVYSRRPHGRRNRCRIAAGVPGGGPRARPPTSGQRRSTCAASMHGGDAQTRQGTSTSRSCRWQRGTNRTPPPPSLHDRRIFAPMGANIGHYATHPQVDDLFARGRATTDPATRAPGVQPAHAIAERRVAAVAALDSDRDLRAPPAVAWLQTPHRPRAPPVERR